MHSCLQPASNVRFYILLLTLRFLFLFLPSALPWIDFPTHQLRAVCTGLRDILRAPQSMHIHIACLALQGSPVPAPQPVWFCGKEADHMLWQLSVLTDAAAPVAELPDSALLAQTGHRLLDDALGLASLRTVDVFWFCGQLDSLDVPMLDLLWRLKALHQAHIVHAGPPNAWAKSLQASTIAPLQALRWRGTLRLASSTSGMLQEFGPWEMVVPHVEPHSTSTTPPQGAAPCAVADTAERIDLEVQQVVHNPHQLQLLALSTFVLQPMQVAGQAAGMHAQLLALSPEIALMTRCSRHARKRPMQRLSSEAWHRLILAEAPLPDVAASSTLDADLWLLCSTGSAVLAHLLPPAAAMSASLMQVRARIDRGVPDIPLELAPLPSLQPLPEQDLFARPPLHARTAPAPQLLESPAPKCKRTNPWAYVFLAINILWHDCPPLPPKLPSLVAGRNSPFFVFSASLSVLFVWCFFLCLSFSPLSLPRDAGTGLNFQSQIYQKYVFWSGKAHPHTCPEGHRPNRASVSWFAWEINHCTCAVRNFLTLSRCRFAVETSGCW